MLNFLRGKKEEKEETKAIEKLRLLVIDSGKSQNDWYNEFKDVCTLDGQPIVVEQAGWDEIRLTSFETASSIPLSCTLGKSSNPLPNTPQNRVRAFNPDVVLVRNEVRCLGDFDYRSVLFGFQYAGIPAVNTWESIYGHLERPWVFSELMKLQRKFGRDQFPLVSQAYFPTFKDVQYYMSFPCVVKVGHAHAGYGKMLLKDHKQMEDMRSVLAMANQYSTAEVFVVATHDLRIQKIGDHIRAFKRTSVSGNWKTNTGTSILEEIQVKPRYAFWANEAAKMFGGMDILTVDVVVAEDGEEFILEVNGTASGLAPDCFEEDNGYIRELVLQRIHSLGLQASSGTDRGDKEQKYADVPAGVISAKQERSSSSGSSSSSSGSSSTD